jgi:hypothetical protein
MKVQFATYDLITEDNNVYSSSKIADEYHQTWHYVYFSYSHKEKKAVAAIKQNGDTPFITREFSNVNHHDIKDIKKL